MSIIFILLIPLILFIIWLVDRLITKARLKVNQKEWDEYSKDMTRKEKDEKFLRWLEESKARHGWSIYYIPHK